MGNSLSTNPLAKKGTRGNRYVAQLSWILVIALLTVIVWQAIEIKRISKAPMPRQWNQYSAAANEFLYLHRQNGPALGMPIAHAGGAFDGKAYTNSLAALEKNYEVGFRLFEIDLNWTSDGELVAIHGWSMLGNEYASHPPSFKMLGHDPATKDLMTLDRLYQWMSEHPDAYIITDIKYKNLEGLAKIRMERPSLVPQFIPQIYLPSEWEPVQSQGFRNVILTLYRCLPSRFDNQIIEFVSSTKLFAVTMPVDRCLHGDLTQRLTRAKTAVYVHTVNDQAIVEQVGYQGASGVYTDHLTAEEALVQPSFFQNLTVISPR